MYQNAFEVFEFLLHLLVMAPALLSLPSAQEAFHGLEYFIAPPQMLIDEVVVMDLQKPVVLLFLLVTPVPRPLVHVYYLHFVLFACRAPLPPWSTSAPSLLCAGWLLPGQFGVVYGIQALEQEQVVPFVLLQVVIKHSSWIVNKMPIRSNISQDIYASTLVSKFQPPQRQLPQNNHDENPWVVMYIRFSCWLEYYIKFKQMSITINSTFTADKPIYYPSNWQSGKTALQQYNEFKETMQFWVMRNVAEIAVSAMWVFIIFTLLAGIKQIIRLRKLDDKDLQKLHNRSYIQTQFVLSVALFGVILAFMTAIGVWQWGPLILVKGIVSFTVIYSARDHLILNIRRVSRQLSRLVDKMSNTKTKKQVSHDEQSRNIVQ